MSERSLNSIISEINTTIKDSVSFGSQITTWGQCYLQTKDEKTFPLLNNGDGQGRKIQWNDTYPLQIYHRILTGGAKDIDTSLGFGSRPYEQRVYQMRLVGVGSKGRLSGADFEDNQEFCKEISDAIPNILTNKEYIQTGEEEVIKQNVYDEEFTNTVELTKLSLEGIAFWIDYELRIKVCYVRPPALDPDAQAWIDRMTNPTEAQQTAINKFVIAEKAAGNWSLYDEFFCLALGSTNSLIGAKSKTATANGGITWDSDGALFNGTTGYLDSNFTPSIDGNNFTANNAIMGVYIKEITHKAQTAAGVFPLTGGESSINESLDPTVNTRINSSTILFVAQEMNIDSTYVSARPDSSNGKLYENGIEIGTISSTSAGLASESIHIGVLNFADIINTGFFSGKISSFIVGGESGFNQALHHTNVTQLINSL